MTKITQREKLTDKNVYRQNIPDPSYVGLEWLHLCMHVRGAFLEPAVVT